MRARGGVESNSNVILMYVLNVNKMGGILCSAVDEWVDERAVGKQMNGANLM